MFITLHQITDTGRIVKTKIRADNYLVVLEEMSDGVKPKARTRVYTGCLGRSCIEVSESMAEIEAAFIEAAGAQFAPQVEKIGTHDHAIDAALCSGPLTVGTKQAEPAPLKPGSNEHLALLIPQDLKEHSSILLRYGRIVWHASRTESVAPGDCPQCKPWSRPCDGSCKEVPKVRVNT